MKDEATMLPAASKDVSKEENFFFGHWTAAATYYRLQAAAAAFTCSAEKRAGTTAVSF